MQSGLRPRTSLCSLDLRMCVCLMPCMANPQGQRRKNVCENGTDPGQRNATPMSSNDSGSIWPSASESPCWWLSPYDSQCIGKRFRLECRTVGQSGKKLATRATFAVPYAGHLRGRFNSWEGSLRQWLTQLPSAETRRYVGIFLSVYRVRPGADVDANSDDDGRGRAV